MTANRLNIYLTKFAQGDIDARQKIFEVLARTTVYIPASIKENETLIRCRVAMLEEVEQPTVAAFSDESRLREWRKTRRAPTDVLAVLGSDLCSSLEFDTQVVLNPDSGLQFVLESESVEEVAAVEFTPMLMDHDAEPTDSETSGSEDDQITFEEIPDEDEESSHKSKDIFSGLPLKEEQPLPLETSKDSASSRREDGWFDTDELLFVDGSEQQEDHPVEQVVEDEKLAKEEPQPIAQAEEAAPTEIVEQEDEELNSFSFEPVDADDPVFADSEDSDSFSLSLEHPAEDDGESSMGPDTSSTQYVKPLKRAMMTDSIQDRFLRQPKRRFGEE